MKGESIAKLAVLVAAPLCVANECVPGDLPGKPACDEFSCGGDSTQILGAIALSAAGNTTAEADAWVASKPQFSFTVCRNGNCLGTTAVNINRCKGTQDTFTACADLVMRGQLCNSDTLLSDSPLSLCVHITVSNAQPKVSGDSYTLTVVDQTGASLIDTTLIAQFETRSSPSTCSGGLTCTNAIMKF
jgi:hypothetical protein